jgi:hypothetical protein
MTLLHAIRTLEKACLTKDHTPTTAAAMKEAGEKETKGYLQWLRVQAAITSMSVPSWDQLTDKPFAVDPFTDSRNKLVMELVNGSVFLTDGKTVRRSHKDTPPDSYGVIPGRWECSVEHWNQYAKAFNRPKINP